MIHSRAFSTLILGLALVVPLSGQEDDADDDGLGNVETDVIVERDPARPGLNKITYICRDSAPAKGKDRRAAVPSGTATSDPLDNDGQGYVFTGRYWAASVPTLQFKLYPKNNSGLSGVEIEGALTRAFASWGLADSDGDGLTVPSAFMTTFSATAKPPRSRLDGSNLITWQSLSPGILAVTTSWAYASGQLVET